MKYVDPLGLNHKDLGPGGATAPANKPSAVDKTTSKVVGENTGNNTKYSDCPQETKSSTKTSDTIGGMALGIVGVLAGDDVTGIGVADDVAIPVVVVVGGIAYIGTKIYEKAIEKAEPIVIEKDKPESPVIYRWGSGSNTNLTPRPQDVTGLSFSTIKPPSGSYVVTTMQQVNATGVLVAVKDGPTHVSVVPVDLSAMPEWIESRPDAENNPHPLTQALKTVVVKP